MKIEFLKILGMGGYSDVWLVKNKKIEEYYACKLMIYKSNATKFNTNNVNSGIIRDVASLKYLHHKNIVSLVDVVFINTNDHEILRIEERLDKNEYVKYVGIIMPVANYDLQEIVHDEIELSVLKRLLFQVASGIGYYTNQNILNRDIKPRNILCYVLKGGFKNANLRITDFGIARDNICSHLNDKFTELVYTLWYRPPEILLGGKYNEKADVWALGCIIAQMLLKRPLFTGDSEIDQLYKIFQVLGTPTEGDWPGVSSLPGWKSDFPIWQRRDLDIHVFKGDDKLKNLLNNILILDPAKRFDIFQVLNHPYFDEVRDENVIKLTCEEQLNLRSEYPKKPLKLNVQLRKNAFHRIIENSKTYHLPSYFIVFRTFYLFDDVFSNPGDFDANYIADICFKITSTQDDAPNDMEIDSDSVIKILKFLDFKVFQNTMCDFLTLYNEYYSEQTQKLSEIVCLLVNFGELVFEYTESDLALASLSLACQYYNEHFRHSPRFNENLFRLSGIILTEIENLKEYEKLLFETESSMKSEKFVLKVKQNPLKI